MWGKVFGRVVFTHVVSTVVLIVVLTFAWAFASQQFDVLATLLLGIALPEALIASGFASGWLVLVFAAFSPFVEPGSPTTVGVSIRRHVQFAAFLVATFVMSMEIVAVMSRGHQIYAPVATALTLCGLYVYSLQKSFGGRGGSGTPRP